MREPESEEFCDRLRQAWSFGRTVGSGKTKLETPGSPPLTLKPMSPFRGKSNSRLAARATTAVAPARSEQE